MNIKSTIELKLQPNSAWFNAAYMKPYSLISTLEFSTLSITEDFSYLKKSLFVKNFIASLHSESDSFSLSFVESFKSRNKASLSETGKGIMMICDNKENDYNYVYFLVLFSDPFIQELKLETESIGMFRFTNDEITENKIETCEKIINQLKDIQKQMKIVYENVVQEEVKATREMDHHYDAIQYFHHENKKDREKNNEIEKKVRKKYKKIEKLHRKATRKVNLYCSCCNNEQKNILFLPCGHIEVCKVCLVQNLKIQIGSQHLRNKKCVKCNAHIESILEISY